VGFEPSAEHELSSRHSLQVHPRHPVEYTTIFNYWRLQLYWSRGVTSTDSHHNICHGSNFYWQCDHWLCFFSSVDSQRGCWLHPL